jgi:hypothetical protein
MVQRAANQLTPGAVGDVVVVVVVVDDDVDDTPASESDTRSDQTRELLTATGPEQARPASVSIIALESISLRLVNQQLV